MNKNNLYGGVIWTNHALERIGQRGLTQELAMQTFNHPQESVKGKEGSTQYRRWFGRSTVSVIAKKNERGEWLILSTWVNPPIEGTLDYKKQEVYKRYINTSGFLKILLFVKRHLGF